MGLSILLIPLFLTVELRYYYLLVLSCQALSECYVAQHESLLFASLSLAYNIRKIVA